MRISLLLIFLSGYSIFAQDAIPSPKVSKPDHPPKTEVKIICFCDEEPTFIGGKQELHRFIQEHLQLPTGFNWGSQQSILSYVEFVVEVDGSLTNLEVVFTNFEEANELILAVFHQMPNWIPHKYEGIKKRSNVRIPVSLVLK